MSEAGECKNCGVDVPVDERGYCVECSPNDVPSNGDAFFALIEAFGSGITQAVADWKSGRRARKERGR